MKTLIWVVSIAAVIVYLDAMHFHLFLIPGHSRPPILIAASQVVGLGSAVSAFHSDIGRYPTQEEGFRALAERPADATGWRGPYYAWPARGDQDPWKHAYIYAASSTHGMKFDIHSMGPDGIDGTADDIGNWQLGK